MAYAIAVTGEQIAPTPHSSSRGRCTERSDPAKTTKILAITWEAIRKNLRPSTILTRSALTLKIACSEWGSSSIQFTTIKEREVSRIPTTHVRLQGQNIAVFHAKPRHNTAQERTQILAELTHKMRAGGLRVDKAALAYRDGGSIRFWGDPNLVQYLSRQGVPSPTHTLTV